MSFYNRQDDYNDSFTAEQHLVLYEGLEYTSLVLIPYNNLGGGKQLVLYSFSIATAQIQRG